MSIEHHYHLGAYAVLTNIPTRTWTSTKKCICGAIPRMRDTYCPDCDLPVEQEEMLRGSKYYDELFDNIPELREVCTCIDERDDSYGCTIITNYTQCNSKHSPGEITKDSMDNCIVAFYTRFRVLCEHLESLGINVNIKFGFLQYEN